MAADQLTIRVTGERQRQYAHEIVDRIVIGGHRVWSVVIEPEKIDRNADQNAKFHAMVSDIHQQAFRGYSFAGMKAVLVSQFAAEKDQLGEPLRHPGETAWDWKRRCPVYVRPSTTQFIKAEAAEFIEFLYAAGTDLDIRWSEKAAAAYNEYQEAK